MADYVVVPYSNYTDAANLYTDGVRIGTNSDLSRYYNATFAPIGSVVIKIGFYLNGTTQSMMYVSDSEPSAFRLYITYKNDGGNAVIGTSFLLDNLTPYENWYVGQITGAFYRAIVPITYVFSSREECLSALTAAPVINPGVHVQFHPVYIPSFPGVHVQFNPVILNPYEPGGESEPGGGGGDYDNPTEIISLPSLPTITVEPFINLWAPQPTDMQLLANYLFSDNLWDSVTRQLFGNPIQYIVSLGIVPVPIVSQESTKETFKLATQVSDFQMYKVNSQYKEFICGTVNVPPYWGSFMDYEPHTKIQIYLPFIGFRSLSPSEVVGKSLTVVYHIDVFSGSLVAFIQSNGNLLYQFTGNCLTQMPFAASEYVNAFSGTIGALTGIGTGLIGLSGAFGAGAGALMAIGGFSSAFSSAVTVNKEQVQHGADVTSSFGLLSSRKPYLILNRPKQAIAERQNEYHGYATWYRANDFLFAKGFTKLAQIHLEGIPATDWEIQEIERLLKEGVIF